jgi:hypothetical protein
MRSRRPIVLQPRRGPGLVETMARTAVIAGTANATVNAMNKSAAKKEQAQQTAAQTQTDIADMQAQLAALQAQQMQADLQQAQAAAPAAPQADMIAQLQQLAQLNQAGVLSDAEFEAAKAKLLGL